MPLPAYDAVLCDIDGVIRHWPSMEPLDEAYGLPAGTLEDAAFAPDRLRPAITGEVTDEQWRAAVAADLAEDHGSAERAEAMVRAWEAVLPDVDQDVVALLGQVRRVAAVALVSNATTRLERDLERQGLDRIADLVVNSARIGVAKPDPRVVREAAGRLGVDVRRCLFVDDTEAHVAAARGIGMAGLHYRGIGGLRAALAPLLAGAGVN